MIWNRWVPKDGGRQQKTSAWAVLLKVALVRPRLQWSQNRHNTTVWTDSRQGSINHITVYVSDLHCNRSDWNVISQKWPTVRRQQSGFVSSRHSGHIPAAVCIGFERCCNGQNVSNRTARDMTPLWEQRDKNYHKRDFKPKHWPEIGEKLNVAGKYWNNNTNEIGL